MKLAWEPMALSTEEIKEMLERAQNLLPAEDYRKMKALVDTLAYLTDLVADKETTIRHLRQLLPTASSEKTKGVLAGIGMEGEVTAEPPLPGGGVEEAEAKISQRSGHGRNGAEAFTGAGAGPGATCDAAAWRSLPGVWTGQGV
jgi:hypothetical protein